MEAEKTHIVIKGAGAISPLGYDQASTREAYLAGKPAFKTIEHAGQQTAVAPLHPAAEQKLQQLVASNPHYRQLDRSVQMAIYATQQAAQQAGWLAPSGDQQHDLAVNIGSSRGATGLFEQYFTGFQQSDARSTPSAASPTTTLGNISSWAAHAVNAGGAQISHSMTCSTALMAIANGVAWLKAGMAKRFLAGGSEAALTPFTLSQMKAVGIYSGISDNLFPCRPYNDQNLNTFVLGEGAAAIALEKVSTGQLKKGDILVKAVGFGFEPIKSKTGISTDGQNFQRAMRHALEQLPEAEQNIDLIITHTPGTVAGDKAELAAITHVFGEKLPLLTTNKWLLGHTLGASGALSIDLAIHIFRTQQVADLPYSNVLSLPTKANNVRTVMVCAAGFGGNATCIILKMC